MHRRISSSIFIKLRLAGLHVRWARIFWYFMRYFTFRSKMHHISTSIHSTCSLGITRHRSTQLQLSQRTEMLRRHMGDTTGKFANGTSVGTQNPCPNGTGNELWDTTVTWRLPWDPIKQAGWNIRRKIQHYDGKSQDQDLLGTVEGSPALCNMIASTEMTFRKTWWIFLINPAPKTQMATG